VAVFPQLSIAGRQMFFTELPGVTDERLTPRLRSTAAAVLAVYAGLTVLCTGAFAARGMPFSEALGHAFTTVSAGGFSFHGAGLAHYQDPAVEWIAVVFMFVAGLSMPLLWRALSGRPALVLRNAEVRVYAAVMAAAAVALVVLLWDESGRLAVRQGVFHAVSVMTTTGYSTSDFGERRGQGHAVAGDRQEHGARGQARAAPARRAPGKGRERRRARGGAARRRRVHHALRRAVRVLHGRARDARLPLRRGAHGLDREHRQRGSRPRRRRAVRHLRRRPPRRAPA